MEGLSTVGRTTQYGRGTTGYRAPELLPQEGTVAPTRFSKASDIWSLGCVLYELMFLTRLFASDWAVREYSIRATADVSLAIPKSSDIKRVHREAIATVLRSALCVIASERLSARDIRDISDEYSKHDRTSSDSPESTHSQAVHRRTPAFATLSLADGTTSINITPGAVNWFKTKPYHSIRNSSEVHALMQELTSNTPLDPSVFTKLDPIEKILIWGLGTSLIDLDLFILEKICVEPRDGMWDVRDELLVDVCIGRVTADLKDLAFAYLKKYGRLAQNAWPSKAAHGELANAIKIVLEVRPKLTTADDSSKKKSRVTTWMRDSSKETSKLFKKSLAKNGTRSITRPCTIYFYGALTNILPQ